MIKIKQATKKGYIECCDGGLADLSYPSSKTRRGRVQMGGYISPTVTTGEIGICKIEEIKNMETKYRYRIRKLTPYECFALMGVKREDYLNCAKNQSDSSLYHLAGDSIVVNVLMAIFKQLL